MHAILDALQRLFEEKFDHDTRTPVYTFDVGEYRIGVLLPLITLHLQSISIISFQMAIGVILAYVTYYGIVQSSDSHTKYILGYGVVIPAVLYFPFPVIEFLDIRSLALRLGLIAAPLTITFKCLEAIHGFVPDYAARSLKDYTAHFAYLQYPLLDPKSKQPIRTTFASVGKGITSFFNHSLLNSILYTFLVPSDFAPFPATRSDTDIYIATEMSVLLNNLIAATLVSFSLVFSMNGVSSIIQLLAGFQTEPVVDNPMFGSSSPSDFWGVRWNKLIHRGLKQGVMKPVMKATKSRNLATMAAFLASGLAHEYVWVVMFHKSSHEPDKYIPPFGKSLLFFGWNGILLLFEHWIGRETWKKVVETRPRILISLVVVAMALPVGHLFTGDFRQGGYFRSLNAAWPMLSLERRLSMK